MYLLNAYPGDSYAYRFGVPSGWHSNDEPYTFYEADSSSKLDPKVAQALQGYLTTSLFMVILTQSAYLRSVRMMAPPRRSRSWVGPISVP
ncbi:hypothetical protein BJX63DRAFT_300878 [Aspergillus granulosus]|uniref:Uncharacterized protein n=1 Tax=Aspergillus granulosus TaxID=176169 RepID=A0ABR4H620_9EURO